MSAKGSKCKKKSGIFKIYVQLPFESIRLCLQGISGTTTIRTLKTKLDKDYGLLPEMYHLSYLDASPLDDASCLCSHDVISGATLTFTPWRAWRELLEAAYVGNVEHCFECSANIAGNSSWNRYCAWVALYTAAHQGHHTLVAKLIERTGLGINATGSGGRTALHAAARTGSWKTLCVLVDNGADVRIKDNDNLTAFDLSRKHGHKKCEHSLNFCQWNLQKHHITQERKHDYNAENARQNASREAHMYTDSMLAPGLKGTQGQVYLFQTPNPVSVKHVQESQKVKLNREVKKPAIVISKSGRGGKLEFNYGWFDPLRAQQFIPPTHDVLTYSNPASCFLRPKSLLNPGGYTVKSRKKPEVKLPHVHIA